MKSTGIVRHIDNLGRITLPIELRKTLDMACGDPLEIYTEGNSVILRKHESSCVFCGSPDWYVAAVQEKRCCMHLPTTMSERFWKWAWIILWNDGGL